ncbi:AgmX/PglI C-terminal domain-containing protein [Persicimonas caeni]|nr:AgmX/PglI C-terminal domain-containing protein [Persicimonas caeni]
MKSGIILIAAAAATLACACTTVETATVDYREGGKMAVYDFAIDDGHTLHGPYRYWSAEGQLLTDGHYEDGLRHGAWTEWYQNGQKRFEGRYAHGERVGKFTHWRSDGQRTQVVDYRDGKSAPVELYTYVRDTSSDGGAGKISDDALTKAIRSFINRIQSCYEKSGLRYDQSIGGKIAFTITVDVTGHATEVVHKSWLDHQPTETCMVDVFYHATYPKPRGGEVTFTKTFVLEGRAD